MSAFITRLEQELARLKPATILIVEPDASLGSLLAENLQDYTTQLVGSGALALDICRQTPPDLILIDTNLQDQHPLDLFQSLLPIKFMHRLPIFFLGQQEATREQRMKALEMSVDDYISKPFDIIEFQFRVKNALPGPDQSVELVTGLPGWPAIHFDLERRLSRANWSLLLIHIKELTAYHDLYGTIAGQRIRRRMADILHDVVDDLGDLDDFIGVLSEADFVIITTSQQEQQMIARIRQRFETARSQWYTPQELTTAAVSLPNGRQASLMTPVIAYVAGQTNQFATTIEVIQTAVRQRPFAPEIINGHQTPPLQAIFATS